MTHSTARGCQVAVNLCQDQTSGAGALTLEASSASIVTSTNPGTATRLLLVRLLADERPERSWRVRLDEIRWSPSFARTLRTTASMMERRRKMTRKRTTFCGVVSGIVLEKMDVGSQSTLSAI